RCNLGPALDLEGPDGCSPRNHLVGGRIVGRQAVHLRAGASATLDDIERAAYQREAAESQEIELGHADRVEVVLVELDDGATHGGMLDRQPVAQRRRRQHEAAYVS